MINQKSDHIGAWNFQWLGQSLAEHASVCWDNGSCTRWSRLKQLMLSQIQQSANPGLQIEDYGIQGLHEKMILVGFPRSWPRRNQWNHWDWLKKGLIRLVFNHIIFRCNIVELVNVAYIFISILNPWFQNWDFKAIVFLCKKQEIS